jgi:hypothetical protein
MARHEIHALSRGIKPLLQNRIQDGARSRENENDYENENEPSEHTEFVVPQQFLWERLYAAT